MEGEVRRARCEGRSLINTFANLVRKPNRNHLASGVGRTSDLSVAGGQGLNRQPPRPRWSKLNGSVDGGLHIGCYFR